MSLYASRSSTFRPCVCRLTIPETPRYTMDIDRNVAQAAQDVELFYQSGAYATLVPFQQHKKLNSFPRQGRYTRDEDAPIVRVDAPKATRRDFLNHFSKWENGKVLLGTSWSWFALDIAFYGLGLNSSIILQTIGFGAPSKAAAAKMGHAKSVWLNLKNISVGNLILSAAGLIPGYYFAMAFVDTVCTGSPPVNAPSRDLQSTTFLVT
jgi:PHS family inorganic phosphate transporter-like MFS transporter